MIYEPTPRTRSIILDQPGGLLIRIPSHGHWSVMLFLLLWLCGWLLGEVSAIRALLEPESTAAGSFLLLWLAGWTLGGGFAIYCLAWMAFGEEVVRLKADSLSIKRDIWGLGKVRAFRLSEIRRLRVSPQPAPPTGRPAKIRTPWDASHLGQVAFDYGASTIRFGSSIDEAEALILVERLRERHPSMCGET